MAGWRLYGLFSNKQATTVLLWYVACFSVNLSVYQALSDYSYNETVIFVVQSTSIIISYSILGLFADAFIGRYRLIQFSLWIQWITALMSTFIAALLSEYHFHVWLQTLLCSILPIVLMLGQSSFQVVAIQFGTDQLQGAPSDHLSAFVFWYFMAEKIPGLIFQWATYSLSFIKIKPGRIYLGLNLFTVIFISIVLLIKNCFMSVGKWFETDNVTSIVNGTAVGLGSNPYCLIYRVLKFAKDHQCPVQRSALTYWENEIPSRIDLGKRKYGGPFTTEEVENVKTFLQLLKLLLSLSGILVALSVAEVLYFSEAEFENAPQGALIGALCSTAIACLLILCRALCCFHKCHLSLLRRIGIGAALSIAFMLTILLINSIKYYTSLSNEAQNLIISYVDLVIPTILLEISHFVLAISLLEFIIAQSPHTMKGILIGFYYVIRFGLAGVFGIIQKFFCKYVYSAMSCSDIGSYIVITIIALVSFIMYFIVACKYKLRERDEVINVHIFAEEYYGTRQEDDSLTVSDNSDVDWSQDA